MMAGVGALLLVAALAQRGDDLLSEQIRRREESSELRLAQRATVLGFYARRAFRPAWNDEHGPNRLVDDLVAALNRADLEGLNPEDYHVNEIGALLGYVRLATADGRTPETARLADLDLLLTDA